MFASVVEHHSFSGAAEAIGVSKATVSKAVTRLEASLGTTLFHRTSRRLSLTDSGRDLAERAARILSEAREAEDSARNAARTPSGLVRIAAPLTFGRRHVAPIIADLLTEYPTLEIDLRLSDARVDIVAEGFDIALRIADLPDSSLRARRLGAIPSHVVAAPSYLAKHGTPRHPAELGEHSCFGYANIPSSQAWQFRGPGGEEAAVRPTGMFRTDSGDAMVPALCAGLGIARLPDFIVGEDIASGKLVPILTDWQGWPPIALHLMTPPSTLRPARVELVIEYLTARLKGVCNA